MIVKTLSVAAICFGAAVFLGCGTGNSVPEPAEEVQTEIEGALGPMEAHRAAPGFDRNARQFIHPQSGGQFGGHLYPIGPDAMPRVHSVYVEEFIRKPGEGAFRNGPPPTPGSHWVELVAESEGDRIPAPGGPGTGTATYDAVAEMLKLPDGATRSVRERVWLLRERLLMSTEAKSGPAVYTKTPESRHDLIDAAKTGATSPKRAPDDFETAALAKLRAGDEVALQASDRTLRVLGAIRARYECRACHKVDEGTMLGAFSYTLTLQSEATPNVDKLKDKAGLTDEELGAIRVIESRGGKVIRAPGGPVTELQLSFARKREQEEKGPPPNQFSGRNAIPVTRLQLRDSGLRILGAFPELRALDVSGSLVSDVGLKSIAELKHLKTLDLRDTAITEAGIAEIKRALPECEIRSPEFRR